MALVFVGGVHGVGKSSLCAEVAADLGIAVHTASTVIRAERGTLGPDRGKAVVDVGANQRLLVTGVRRLLGESSALQLLEGHFALRTTLGDIECVDLDVFAQMTISHAICIRDEPERIRVRLQLRDGTDSSIEAITSLQQAEIAHAAFVSRSLGIPLTVLPAFDAQSMREHLKSLIASA